jgi:hypothetical protein
VVRDILLHHGDVSAFIPEGMVLIMNYELAQPAPSRTGFR